MIPKNTKVLIVDDQEINISILVNFLIKNYNLYIAKSGKDAIQIIEQQAIDLVLLDIIMPEMDGYSVLKIIKESKLNSNTPVIFLSSIDDEQSILKGFSIGAVDFISKPIQKEILIARVNTHLNLHFLQKNLQSTIEKQKTIIIHQTKKAAMGEMISIISHQLVQPLNALSMANDFIDKYALEQCSKQAEIKKFTLRIKKYITHMSDIIDDYRNFFNPNRESELFSIQDTINKALFIVEKNISSENITIVKNIPEDDINISGYANDFVQVVLNILSNAKDALIADDSQNNKIINIDLNTSKDSIILQISDNGIGVTKDNINNIFEYYYSTKGKSGTGIGLYLSKMIIENNFFGSISVISKKNKTVFEVKLDSF